MTQGTEPLSWPALASWNGNLPPIRCRRALRGKVHRARSDYRWIAASLSWEPKADLLERLTLGWEDDPRPVFAWTPTSDGFCAMTAYASPARDADGRSGGLEKQILCWQPEPSDPPPLVGAFAMAAVIDSYPDSVSAGLWRGEEWTDSFYRFALPDWEIVNCGGLAGWIDKGRQEVASALTQGAVAGIYQQLLDGVAPAVSPVALPPLGWLCLLLPLGPERIERISILSVPPTARAEAELFADWSLTFLGGGGITRGQLEFEAARLADCLMNGPAAAPAEQSVVVEQFIEAPRGAPVHSFGYTLLQRYLNSPHRAFHPPTLNPEVFYCTEDEGLKLAETIREFEAQLEATGAEADKDQSFDRKRHLRVKAQVARAWLYAVAPWESVANALPPDQGSTVPPLHFAKLVFGPDWRGLTTLGELPVFKR